MWYWISYNNRVSSQLIQSCQWIAIMRGFLPLWQRSYLQWGLTWSSLYQEPNAYPIWQALACSRCDDLWTNLQLFMHDFFTLNDSPRTNRAGTDKESKSLRLTSPASGKFVHVMSLYCCLILMRLFSILFLLAYHEHCVFGYKIGRPWRVLWLIP